MKRLFVFGFLILVVVVLVIGVGRSEESIKPEETAPQFPPTDLLRLDYFTRFTESTLYKQKPVRCFHFDMARKNVIEIEMFINPLLFFPLKFYFDFGGSQTLTRVDDTTWLWTFSNVEGNNISLAAHLVSSDSVEWEMRVKNDTLTNFLWCIGRCNRGATGGWWRFNKLDSVMYREIPRFWISWSRNPADTTGDTTDSLMFTDISDSDPIYGDTLSYSVNGTVVSTRFHFGGGESPGNWTIVWDRVAHYGYIIYPDGRRGCWDADLHCIDCDSIPLPTKR